MLLCDYRVLTLPLQVILLQSVRRDSKGKKHGQIKLLVGRGNKRAGGPPGHASFLVFLQYSTVFLASSTKPQLRPTAPGFSSSSRLHLQFLSDTCRGLHLPCTVLWTITCTPCFHLQCLTATIYLCLQTAADLKNQSESHNKKQLQTHTTTTPQRQETTTKRHKMEKNNKKTTTK